MRWVAAVGWIAATIGLACAPAPEPPPTHVTPVANVDSLARQPETLRYFAEIALDQEYGEGRGIVRKWADDIRLAVHGDPTDSDRLELDRVVAELNGLLRGTRLSIETERTNAEIHFEPERRFSRLESNYRSLNHGFFWTRWNNRYELVWARILIDSETVTDAVRLHLIREELTQCLGLMQDSPRYRDSIFQVEWTETTEFAPIDRALVYLLYDPRLVSGMRGEEAMQILSNR